MGAVLCSALLLERYSCGQRGRHELKSAKTNLSASRLWFIDTDPRGEFYVDIAFPTDASFAKRPIRRSRQRCIKLCLGAAPAGRQCYRLVSLVSAVVSDPSSGRCIVRYTSLHVTRMVSKRLAFCKSRYRPYASRRHHTAVEFALHRRFRSGRRHT
jgi:hypothetical protein